MNSTPKIHMHLALRQTNSLSGTPRILKRQIETLKKRGHSVSVISESFHKDLKSDKSIKCLKARRLPVFKTFQRKFFNFQCEKKIQKKETPFIIGHGDILHQDVLLLHNCVHLHQELTNDWNSKNASLEFHKMIFEKGSFKKLICNSKLMKEDIVKRFKVKEPVDVIYPGHDQKLKENIQSDKVQEIRKKVGGEVILGVITSGDLENRGAYVAIEALSKLSSRASLLIIGREKFPNKVYEHAKNFGVRDRVLWMDAQRDVQNLIASVDILVHAAKLETFGMVVLEAMSLSRPVVVTSTVGASEILPEIQKEFIIEEQSASLLLPKLQALIENHHLREELGAQNELQSRKYTWEKYDELFLKSIAPLISVKENFSIEPRREVLDLPLIIN